IPHDIKKESNRLRVLIDQIHSRNDNDPELAAVLSEKVNEGCENLNIYVKKITQKYLEEGKIVGLLGGDHGTPLGFLRALSERHDRFGILQIDAHADLRKAYEGFTYSHGSVMFNALKISSVSKLVQVGIRDFCDEEYQMMKRGSGRIKTFFDDELAHQLSQGHAWEVLCKDIVKELPEKVYISFDIDGLDPKLCPHTGTPVPGGLDFRQAVTLIKTVALSGKRIIGFDLNEVAVGDNEDWDANVGARILWNLCNWTLRNLK
ncbi:MAG: agmatinase family protein, partial [Cyclobacteriaceae bacterium]|nr:agmatinase family protein [Cyclobacteriaceae bacterium]